MNRRDQFGRSGQSLLPDGSIGGEFTTENTETTETTEKMTADELTGTVIGPLCVLCGYPRLLRACRSSPRSSGVNQEPGVWFVQLACC